MPLPLQGIKVIELAGLAPVPLHVKVMLADYGAEVIRIDRPGSTSQDILARGKHSISLDLKHPDGLKVLLRLISQADVVLDPFRPGVLEKLGLSPAVIEKTSNGRAILARLTGFARTGKWAQMAGHDINYLALSGVLSLLKPADYAKPVPALNLLSDFAGGSLICVLGIMLALFERTKSGKGQVVETDMISGLRYMASFPLLSQKSPYFSQPVGENLLDGGAPFYATYVCSDGKFITVGALEPHFFLAFMSIILAAVPSKSRLDISSLQADRKTWPALKHYLTKAFQSKTRDEWVDIFGTSDSCVAPVLTLQEAAVLQGQPDAPSLIPTVAPQLSRTPGKDISLPNDQSTQFASFTLSPGRDSLRVLKSFGYPDEESKRLCGNGAVEQPGLVKSKL